MEKGVHVNKWTEDIELQFELIAFVMTKKYTIQIHCLTLSFSLMSRRIEISLNISNYSIWFQYPRKKLVNSLFLSFVVSSRSLCIAPEISTRSQIHTDRFEGKNSCIVCHLDKYEQIECVCLASTKWNNNKRTHRMSVALRNEDLF